MTLSWHHENAVAEANAKAREAEAKVLTLTDQHTSAMEASLKEQREVLEKAKEDAVNAEKARAFEENQKLSNKVTDLQRALENKTAEELGEGAEIDLFEALKKEFPDDNIPRIPKGTPGADILHVVMLSRKEVRNDHLRFEEPQSISKGACHQTSSRPTGCRGRARNSFDAQIPARHAPASPSRRRAACQPGAGRIHRDDDPATPAATSRTTRKRHRARQ